MKALTNCLSYTAYEYIDDCETYDAAIKTLESIFVKTPNEVFARHLLATCKQQSGQTQDEFMQVLRKLSKDCNFTDVTAVQHRDGFIRDAFINGLSSHSIRQRLLENRTLSLEAAFTQARSLEDAYKNSQAYETCREFSSAVASSSNPQDSETEESSAISYSKSTCYFCGSKKKNMIVKIVLHAQPFVTNVR